MIGIIFWQGNNLSCQAYGAQDLQGCPGYKTYKARKTNKQEERRKPFTTTCLALINQSTHLYTDASRYRGGCDARKQTRGDENNLLWHGYL